MSAKVTAKTRLLAVDDDRLVLASIAEGLARAGYAVWKATSGAEAVRICADRSPDLVIMDVNMPGMSGIDAARAIREQSRIPIFFLSAFDDEAIVKDAIAEGGLGYLIKPVRTDQLVTSIEAALARAADINALKTAAEDLGIALKGDRNIGIATGIIMERHRLTSADAFEALRRHARSQQRKLGEVAAEIISADEKLNLSGR